MKKIFATGLLVLGLSAMPLAWSHAQTSYSFSSFSELASCEVILRDLSLGMRGSDVLSLQEFLVSQNYPGSGSWMLTGYFWKATEQAVKNFQSSQELPATGIVDVLTRTAIARVTCDGLFPGNPYSMNGWPFYQQMPYQYPYYPYARYPASQTPALYSISPASGVVGNSVTLRGSGFSYQNNSVRFGQVLLTNLSSVDGQSLSFSVPQQGIGYGSQYITPGTYDVSVTTASGQQTNKVSFTVNGYTYPYQGGGPIIGVINGPTYLPIETQGTWMLSASDAWNSQYLTTSVRFGDEYAYSYGAYAQPQTTSALANQTMTFTHTYYQRGTYTVTFTVTNAQGQQDSSSISVVVY